MITKELLEYIRKQIAEGVSVEALQAALRETGWAGNDIADALRSVGVKMRPSASAPPLPVGEPDLWPDLPVWTARPADSISAPSVGGVAFEARPAVQDEAEEISPQADGAKDAGSVASNGDEGRTESVEPHPFFAERTGDSAAKNPIASQWAEHPRGPIAVDQNAVRPMKGGGRFLAMFLGVGLIAAAGAAGGYWYYLRQQPEPDPVGGIKASFAKLRTYSALAYSGTLRIKAGKVSELDARARENPIAAAISAFLGLAQILPASTSTAPLPDIFSTTQVALPMTTEPMPATSPSLFVPSIQQGSLMLEFDGAFDRSDASVPKGFTNWTLDADFPSYGSFSVSAESRMIEKTVYARVTKLPVLGLDLNAIKGQWIRIDLDPEKLKEGLGDGDALPQGLVSEKNAPPTAEEMARLMDGIKDIEFFTDVRASPPENFDGASVARYDFGVDKAAVKKFLESVATILDERRISENQRCLSEGGGTRCASVAGGQNPEKMGEAADNFLRYATSIGGAVWIGSDDDLPHRVQLRATFADPKDAEHAVRFSLDMRLKDFGKTLSLAPPGESLALNEVFTEIFEKPQKRARDARRISDVKQLQLAAELYFDKNGAYPQDLSLMAPEFIRSIPVDSVRGTPPVYSASPDRKKYHMGTVLEDESNGALRNDADFNSEKAGWKNGFDGDDAGLCVETGGRADIEAACYDVVP